MPSTAQRQTSSGSSTPNMPDDEAERTEREHQQEVDLHLATSMSRGPDLLSRSRSRSGGNEMQREGVSNHFRRDTQAEQDAQFFEGSASPRSRPPIHDHTTPTSSSTAAARLYRQTRRRTLSDTSVDSQAGFIDHRGSQASMPVRTGASDRHLSPRDIVRSAVRSRSSRLRSEVQSGNRARATSASEESEEAEQDRERDGSSATEGSPLSRARHAGASNLSAARPGGQESGSATRRGASFDIPDGDLDAQILQGSAVANGTRDDDEDGVVDHRDHHSTSRRSPISRDFLHRQDSRRSERSQRSHNADHQHHSDHEEQDGAGGFSPSLSRRPSDLGKVEEDVCYPMLQIREADMGERGPHGQSPPRATDSRLAFAGRGQMGIPGVLPNFPFPFDFAALEDFCVEEREQHGIAIPKAKLNGGELPASCSSASPQARTISFSRDQGEGAGMMRRRKNGEGRRQRKLSESVSHVSRYQRKLALFEGTSPGQRNDESATQADSKTPLLNTQTKSRPSFGATHHRSATSATEKARPYRFSFYSNALPSTIHARSMAEIPADGQSFEDLFVGRQESPPPEEWEGSVTGDFDPHAGPDAFLPGQKPGSTGQNTPVGQAAAPSLASYKQGGIGSGRGSAQPRGGKERHNIIRSVEDAEANTWWLDVLCPTDAEMKVLGKVFGIHPLTIEDILMEETREKIELFRNYYFVCFRSFDQDPYSPTYLEPLNMYVIVFREGTLSFHFRGTPHPQNVRRRIKQLKDFINVTSDWISYALIDDITDAFGPLIQNIEYEVDSIDELVLILKDAEQSDMLRRIGTCRKKVMGLLRLMGNKADVVKGLAKRCNENWSVAPKSDIGLYLSDIQDHLITMTQNLNHYEKILSRSHSNYLAQISIEMTDANNQINDVLSKLTALGTVLIPMNLVTGLWGMNVRVPGEGVESLTWFFSIVGGLLAFALAGGYGTYRAFSR